MKRNLRDKIISFFFFEINLNIEIVGPVLRESISRGRKMADRKGDRNREKAGDAAQCSARVRK